MRTVILLILFVGYQATVIPEKYLKYLKNIKQLAEDYRRTCLGQIYYENESSDDSEAHWKPWELEYLENLALSMTYEDDSNEFDENSKYFEGENNGETVKTTTEDDEDSENNKSTKKDEKQSKNEDDDDDIDDSDEDLSENNKNDKETTEDKNEKNGTVKKSKGKMEKKSKNNDESEEESDDSNESS